MPGFDMSDYVPVNERIDQFYRAHPEGSLQSEIVELTASRVTVKASAYRKPDDERPGIGHSSLEIPGSTPYTRGSEIENCETSAWGRAIAALGFEVKRGVASREEVRNKQPEQRGGAKPSSPRAAPVQYRRGELAALMSAHNLDLAAVEQVAAVIGIPKDERPMSDQSMDRLIEAIESPPGVPSVAADGGAESSDSAPSGDEAVPPGTPPESVTLDDILAVTGGELVPPKPKTPEYDLLPATEKAAARAYWQKHEVAA